PSTIVQPHSLSRRFSHLLFLFFCGSFLCFGPVFLETPDRIFPIQITSYSSQVSFCHSICLMIVGIATTDALRIGEVSFKITYSLARIAWAFTCCSYEYDPSRN